MSKVKGAVHVREGEGLEVLGLVTGLHCEKLVAFPDGLRAML